MKQRIVKGIVLLAVCSTVAVGVGVLPTDAWHTIGERAAMLAVGLQKPQETTEMIGSMMRPSLQAPNGALSEEVILGNILVQPVTSTEGVIPEKKAGGGTVLTQQLSAGKEFIQGVAIKNNTGKAADIADALKRKPAVAFDKTSDKVQVLITHTHTTECYLGYDAGFYNPDDASRTDDPKRNMVAVGERVAAKLRAAGIGVIHDTAIHDQPYNSAYSHSKKAVEAYLKQYPSICVVLDIHRDAIYPSDNTRVKPTVVINGKKAAQMMIIVGMLNSKNSPNKHTAENLSFGAHLQQAIHKQYPGLMRPMVLAKARYNQQLCNGMILVEMGSDVNTLEEACFSGDLLGEQVAQLLLKGM